MTKSIQSCDFPESNMFTFLNKITLPFDDPWESYPDSLFYLNGSIEKGTETAPRSV